MRLNLPAQSRSSSTTARILSLTSPGVKSPVVLESIFSDIINGTSTGFVDHDAEGQKRTLFLDLVGFVDDIPALNDVLDVMGHTAAACCHLCRFLRRSSTLVGSQYTDTVSDGFNSAFRRGSFQHAAVHDALQMTMRVASWESNPSQEAYFSRSTNSGQHFLRQRLLVLQRMVAFRLFLAILIHTEHVSSPRAIY